MTKKLEETFNLPPMHESTDDEDDDFDFEDFDQLESSDSTDLVSVEEMNEKLQVVDKIDKALGTVTDLDGLDTDMDDYAKQAMEAFVDLMDLGKNVEDRHCASVFDSASKMMSNALSAKTAKADRKLKVIQMQLQKQKLDLEEKKLKMKERSVSKAGEPTEDGAPATMTMSRNDLLNDIMKRVNEQNQDK